MLWVSSLSSGYLFTHQEGTTHISLYPLLRVMEMLWKRWNSWGPARWLRGQRCLLHIPSDLGSTPRAHIQVKGENRLHTVVLWPTHMRHGMGVHTDTHVGAGKSLDRKEAAFRVASVHWKDVLLVGHWAVTGGAWHRRGFGVLVSFAGPCSLMYT